MPYNQITYKFHNSIPNHVRGDNWKRKKKKNLSKFYSPELAILYMLWSLSFLFSNLITIAMTTVNMENATANPIYNGTFVLTSDLEAIKKNT